MVQSFAGLHDSQNDMHGERGVREDVKKLKKTDVNNQNWSAMAKFALAYSSHLQHFCSSGAAMSTYSIQRWLNSYHIVKI